MFNNNNFWDKPDSILNGLIDRMVFCSTFYIISVMSWWQLKYLCHDDSSSIHVRWQLKDLCHNDSSSIYVMMTAQGFVSRRQLKDLCHDDSSNLMMTAQVFMSWRQLKYLCHDDSSSIYVMMTAQVFMYLCLSWVSSELGLGSEVSCPKTLPENENSVDPMWKLEYGMTLPIPIWQILDSSKLNEFAEDNFKFDENSRKLS